MEGTMARAYFTTHIFKKILWLIIGTIFTNSAVYSSTDIDGNTCTTSGCRKAAARISNSINETFNPCNKFYQFACGGYRRTKFPKNFNRVNTSTDIIFEIQGMLKARLEKKIEDNELRTFKLLQSHYNACISASNTIGANEKGQILNIIDDLGGWPVLDREHWNKSRFNRDDLIRKIRKLGFEKATKSFADFGIVLYATRHIFLFGASTGIDKKYLTASLSNDTANEEVKQYMDKMINYARLLGADPVQARTELTKSLEFEKQLANISINGDGSFFDRSSFKKVLLDFPAFPWDNYLEDFVPNQVGFKTKNIDDELDVGGYIMNVDFVKNWSKLVANTSEDVLANYAIWRVVEELMDMTQDLVSKESEHWQTCINRLTKSMPVALGALYVRNDFNKSLKADVQNMAENIRKSYKHVISEAKWLDQTTKNKAMQKLDSTKVNVAYPDVYLDDKKLDDYHENLTFPTGNFYLTSLNLNKFHRNNEIKSVTNDKNWNIIQSPTVINAFNYKNRNSIDLHAAMIRQMYISDRPNYLNYATMGFFIAHEMTHAFDTIGINWGSNGTLEQLFEGDSHVAEHYSNNTKCITEQFNKYGYVISKKRIPFDSAKTLDENIADIGGFQVAYRHYEEWIKQAGPDPGLPGLNSYTPRQLFWIGAATEFCSKVKVSAFKELESDTHSPNAFRIIGSFVNMPEFARDFNCQAGSRMNPIKRCTLW